MKRSWRYVLLALSDADGRYVSYSRLPDGNGRNGGASGTKLSEMRKAGLIEYGREPGHAINGYRITDAGRRALAEQNKP